jgi:4a-hydroxytetrahydrobiopterin dehydratase
MVIAVLDPEELAGRLTALPGWTLRDGKLHRAYQFTDFVEAFGYMTRVALVAERMGHHPAWFNVWGTVVVDLDTHDAGGVTERDFELARAMEQLASGRA